MVINVDAEKALRAPKIKPNHDPCPPNKEAIARLYLSFAYSGYGLLLLQRGRSVPQ